MATTQAPAQAEFLVLTTDEAARRLGLSPRTLERWRQEGTGPAYVRLGRKRTGYRPAALAAFLEAGTVATRPARP